MAKATSPKIIEHPCDQKCTQYAKPEEVIANILMVNDVQADSSKLPIASLKPEQNKA